MRALDVALVLLILACAAHLPEAKFSQRIIVQVLDQDFRPVDGAQVYVEYQLNSVDGNTKTTPRLTNSSGVANFIFSNYEEIESSTSYSYTAFVKYGNQTKAQGLVADGDFVRGRAITEFVQSYLLRVNVRGQNERPIS